MVSSVRIAEISPMTLAATDTLHDIAQEASVVFERRWSLPLFSARYPAFNLDEAYRANALAHKMRLGKGYKPVGRKAGFTNSRIWDEYGVRAPNWGYVYDRTVHDLATPLSLAPYAEPKIEPEIIVGISAAPSPGMDDAALLGCIGWIAHGFEVVQSVFSNWKFGAADSVAVNAMHGALLIGPRHEVGSRAAEWLRALPNFEVELFCDGMLMDRGRGSNVIEGPLSVIRHVTRLLEMDPDNLPLAAGELVATGTLTRALPVKAGETWTTKLKGIALEGISLRFC
jgi:2-oxo-3-hexenedioate decarboxylase